MMNKKERTLMIEMAMKTLSESNKLDSKAKKRGLKSLEQAYEKSTKGRYGKPFAE